MDNLNIKLGASVDEAISKLKRVGSSLGDIGKKTTNAGIGTDKFQKQIHKLNNRFTNLNKDLNRSSEGLGKLGNSFKSLNTAINIAQIYAYANALAKAINSAMDMVETNNLFAVSLGAMSEEADKTLLALSEVYGLDITNLRNATGTYSMLARSMGMTAEQSETLATSTTQLALELSSLTNIPFAQVMADLRSGLVGQSETVYKYGVDITEASLQQEAMRQGIEKSVRTMTQAEKMGLRYAVMIRNTGLAQGDFAKTINEPANQVRILAERFTTLTRTIGTMFIPILQAVLPYLNAVLSVLITIGQAVAKFLGYTEEIPDYDMNLGNLGSGINDANKNLDKTVDKAKELHSVIMGFDELNILTEPKTSSTSDAEDEFGGIGDIKLPDYDMELESANKVEQIINDITGSLEKLDKKLQPVKTAFTKLWKDALKPIADASWTATKDFYNGFIKPIGEWTISEDGLPRLTGLLTDLLDDIDWKSLTDALDKFWKALNPLLKAVWDGFLNFLTNLKDRIEPIAENKIKSIAESIETIADALESIDEDSAIAFGETVGWILELGAVGVGINRVVRFANALKTFFLVISDKGTSIKSFFSSGNAGELFLGFMTKLSAFLTIMGPYLPAGIDLLFQDAPQWIKDLKRDWDEMWDKIWELLFGGIDSFIVKPLFNFDLAQSLGEAMLKEFKNIDNEASVLEIGKSILMGIIYAISSAIMFLAEPIVDLVIEIVKGIASAFGTEKAKAELKTTGKTVGGSLATEIGVGFGLKVGALAPEWAVKLAIAWNEAKKDITAINVKFYVTAGTKVKDLQGEYKLLVAVWKARTVKFYIDVATKLQTIVDKYNEFVYAWKKRQVDFTIRSATAVKTIRDKWNELSNAFKGKTVEFVVKLATSLGDIKNFVNAVIKSVNDNLIAKLDFDYDFGIFKGSYKAPRIPYLAKGGIVDDTTLAVIGEQGKEAVMPLENNTGWITDLAVKISERGGNSGSLTESTIKNAMKQALNEANSGDIVLNVDSRELARANNRGLIKLDRMQHTVRFT